MRIKNITVLTTPHKTIPQAISTSVKRGEYALIKVKLVRSYIAYDMPPNKAPCKRACCGECTFVETKIIHPKTIADQARSPIGRLNLIDPFGSSSISVPNSRIMSHLTMYPSQIESIRIIVASPQTKETIYQSIKVH